MRRKTVRGPTAARFATVVLDIDSTLSGIEGIDWLAGRRDATTLESVRSLTNDAMSGRISLDEAYGKRLEMIAPTSEEVRALGRAYCGAVALGAREAIAGVRRLGVRVVAISGGLRDAVLPLCRDLGLADTDVFAVALQWNTRGAYADFDRSSPLTTQDGKARLLRTLQLPRPVLAVGDGSTDIAMRSPGAADAFAAYVGFVRREQVVAAADHIVASFDELLPIVRALTT